MRELPFYTNWSYAHPRAIELAEEVASLAPGDLNRVFFVSGGSEAVDSAWKLARQYHAQRGERRWKAIARNVAYHGTTMGALSINGIPPLRTPVRAARPRGRARPQHEPLPPARATRPRRSSRRSCSTELEHTLDAEGPGHDRHGPHGAGAERRRLLHAAGGLLAGRPGDLRPLRDPACRGRGDHRLRPPRRLVRLREVRHPARTWSRARRACPPRTPRSARWSSPTALRSRSWAVSPGTTGVGRMPRWWARAIPRPSPTASPSAGTR